MNPDLANIFGKADLNFDNFIDWIFLIPRRFSDFQIPGFPDSQTGPGAGLGPAWTVGRPGFDPHSAASLRIV